MLSFTVTDQKTIQIDCDDEGLTSLIEVLETVRQHGHVHIKAPGAGGRLLSEKSPFGVSAVSEVTVTLGGD